MHAWVEGTALSDQAVELLGLWKVSLRSRDIDPLDVRDSARTQFGLESVVEVEGRRRWFVQVFGVFVDREQRFTDEGGHCV